MEMKIEFFSQSKQGLNILCARLLMLKGGLGAQQLKSLSGD